MAKIPVKFLLIRRSPRKGGLEDALNNGPMSYDNKYFSKTLSHTLTHLILAATYVKEGIVLICQRRKVKSREVK